MEYYVAIKRIWGDLAAERTSESIARGDWAAVGTYCPSDILQFFFFSWGILFLTWSDGPPAGRMFSKNPQNFRTCEEGTVSS